MNNRTLLGVALAILGTGWLQAEDNGREGKRENPGIKVIDFEAFEEGDPPDDVFVVEGDIKIFKEVGGGKVLRMGAEPIVESGALFGESFKGAGIIQASVFGTKRRRSFPRFGIGLHGISGYRLRLVPANQAIELVKDEKVVVTAAYEWVSDQWCHLKLQIKGTTDDGWTIEGKAWKKGEEEPAKALVSARSKEAPGQGKASVWGTPFSSKSILFDDIRVSGGG